MEYRMLINSGNSTSIQYSKPEHSCVEDDLYAALILVKSMYEGLNDEYDQQMFVNGLQQFLESGAIEMMNSSKKS